MTPPPDRRLPPGAGAYRSAPEGFERKSSLMDLYPSMKDGPEAYRDLFTRHARRQEQALDTLIAHNDRIVEVEDMVAKLDESLNSEFSQLKDMIVQGFAQVNLDKAVEGTRRKTQTATIVAVWSVLVVVLGAAAHFLLQPSCKDNEALVSGRCVQIQIQVK